MSFFSRRRVLAALAIFAIAVAAAIGGLLSYLESPAFEARARHYIVEEIERQTGATVTLNNFGWSLWRRRFRLEDLTLRGLEPAEDAPLAHIARIDVGINFQTLIKRRIELYELTITQPEFHLIVTPDGKTNVPSPKQEPPQLPSGFEISIEDFNLVNGSALLNERRVGIDLSLTNLAAILNYHAAREVLEAHLRFDGVLDRAPEVRLAIPYTLSADIDYTRGTILAHRMTITSSRNEVKLQGKINNILSSDISGKLAYTGALQVPFLNYFFPDEKLGGKAAAAGSLEFSKGIFFTQGNLTSQAIDYDGWRVTNVTGDYTYRYPDRKLTFTKLKNQFMGGSAFGEATVDNLPSPPEVPSRVTLKLNYANIDAAGLTRAYPWDPKYRIYSRTAGTMNGWFEGKLARFSLGGHVDLKSYDPDSAPGGRVSGIEPLPLDGSTDYDATPGSVTVTNADGRFRSTAVKANGFIHATMSDLTVDVVSSDLTDIAFLYPNANGSGTFKGAVTGAIAKPVLDGQFTLENHVYQQRKLPRASGSVRLDLPAENAVLRDVRATQGESQILINGATALSGSPVDLHIRSDKIAAQEIRPFIDREIAGTFAGDVHLTELSPNLKLEGEVRADNLAIDNRLIGNVRSHLRFFDPLIELQQLSIRQAESNLTGNVSFNRATEAVKFTARVNAVNLETFYPLGLPDKIQGVMREADLQGGGTIKQPNVSGTAILQNLSVAGEVFPQVRLNLVSSGTKVDVQLDAGRNLNLQAQVDTAASDYPFTGRANFTEYPIEHIAKLAEGSITATGIANLSGSLMDSSRLRGDGRIENADVRIRGTEVRPTQPFTFSFDRNEVTVSDITLNGEATQVTLAGTIGLREPAPLNLHVMGQVDLKLIAARLPDLISSGVMNVQVDVRGTTDNPDLRGKALVSNASIRRPGIFTGLTNLNGTLSFNQNQVRVDKIEGSAGGGTVQAEGTAVLEGGTLKDMRIQIEGNSVRLRGYPEGLRTVVGGRVNLRGSLDAPLLEGNVQIQSLAYRSSFEDFLAMLREQPLRTAASPLGRLRLSLHVEGGRNITIQNQLADVQARVEIDWKGTVDEPAITGHIEASGGTLSFQGNRYTVTRGNIDFLDPLRLQPILDIEAESQIRDYTVILSITGRGDNPKLSLRSDPPLPELEVVSLIAGGLTRDEIAARTNSAPTSERLFQSGAASILFDLLQQRVGNRLGLLGGSRVRIDPYAVSAVNNPGTRITVSQQVTKDFSVTYSQDLSSNREQVILIEYFVSRNTSVVASRDEFGNFGLDLRHRTRLK